MNKLEAAYRLHQECLGKLSFLNIVNRIDEVRKEEIREVTDNSLLKDLVIVFEKVEQSKLNLKKAEQEK